MNLFQLFKRNRISIGFIFYSFEWVNKEMETEIVPTLTEKWKSTQFPLIDKKTLATICSVSDLSVVNVLIWQPKSINFDLVAFVTNMSDGWQGLLRGYSEDYKRKTIRINLSDPDITYPSYAFELMTIDSTRLVQLIKDSDKWKFFEKGDILPFEDSANYSKRKVSERLNNFIIEDYLKKNGIDIMQDDFWKSKGNAIEFSTKLGKP